MKKMQLPKGIKITPVSLVDMMEIQASIEAEYRERGEPIDVPTYKVSVGDGDDFQEFEHYHVVEIDDNDNKIVNSTLESDEDHEIWKTHQNAIERMTGEIALYTTKYLMVEGVRVDWKLFKDWEAKKKKYKIRIPENEDDKKIYFLTSVAFPTPDDQKRIAQQILLISAQGSDPERIEAIEALFRG